MKRIIVFTLAFLTCYSSFSQAIYKTLYSEILNNDREIKILLPRNYSSEDKKAYPVIYVFDGDYLFESVAGNVDCYSYWDDIPDTIVVGINQEEFREADLLNSNQNSLPIDSGAKFFEFIGKELIPYINKTYKTERFKVAIGHGETGNFINYYLIRERPIFNAYITVSPDFATEMPEYILQTLRTLEKDRVFYYMATSSNDVPFIKEKTEQFNTKLKAINNKNFIYGYKNHEGPSHYSLPTHVIPSALEHIFFAFRAITKKEYDTSILKLDTSPVEYLEQKYDEIEDLFGIKKQVVLNDFNAIEAAIKKKEQWDYYKDLAKVARQEYPKTFLSNYYLGLYHEKREEYKKAIKLYRDSYILQEIAGITKDDLLQKADALKAKSDN